MKTGRSEFRIGLEPAKPISGRRELALLHEAHARRPETPALRHKLATVLFEQDAFDATIALFDGIGDTGIAPEDGAILTQALFARGTVDDTRRAVAILEHLVATADAPRQAQTLADLARGYRRLGRVDEARALLVRALDQDPHNLDACLRLAAIDLQSGDAARTIAMLDDLAAAGISHGYTRVARVLALARAGRIAEARAASGFDAFHRIVPLDPPPGLTDAALARELLDHPEQRFGRYGTASERTWRIDKPAWGRAPMVDLLLQGIVAAAERYVADLADIDHPWVRERPPSAVLNCWCVITEGDGFETWHTHPSAWLSGVYYVDVPTAISGGNDTAGCIAFGVPEDDVGTDAADAFGTQVVRPHTGMLMLFPSHSHHRTFPHRTGERRICLAFDICPA